MKLVDFYTNVIKSFGLHTDEGFIYTSDSDDKELVVENGIPVVIPTKDQLKSLIDHDSNEVIKIPFNPLQEDILAKGESTSAKKIRLAIKARLTYTIIGITKMLLKLASDQTKQKKAKYELTKFLASLSEAAIGKKIQHEVDETSIKNWMKIVDNFGRKDSKDLIKIFSNKAGTIGDEKFNRVITIHSPILDILSDENTTKDTIINGITLRPKDIVVFKLMLKFVLSDLDENNVLKLGNNDEHRPVFIGMMQIYLVMIARINKLANLLTYVDSVDSAEASTELFITLEDLESLNKYNGVVKEIPSDKALQKLAIQEEEDEEDLPSLSALNKRNAETRSSVLDTIVNRRERVEEREPVRERARRDEPEDEPSIIDSILGRKTRHDHRDVDNRYSPERIYDRAPEYRYDERTRDVSWGSIRPKPRLSERLEARYKEETRFGGRDTGRGRDSGYGREPLDYTPAGRFRT